VRLDRQAAQNSQGGSGSVAGTAAGGVSSSGAAGTSSASAGSAHAGGGHAGADATGGVASTLAPGLTEACIAFTRAACERDAECNFLDLDCTSATLSCPDVLNAPGSAGTVESLLACAEQYSTFSCDSVQLHELPDCVVPGTRQNGAACWYDSQCASQRCKQDRQDCGVCANPPGVGEACAGYKDCAPGLYCNDRESPATCVMFPERHEANQPCEGNDTCKGGLVCSYADGQVCKPTPTQGISCAEARACGDRDASYCELDGLTCKALPKDGEACGVDAFVGLAMYCAPGFVCVATSDRVGVCTPLQPNGQPCLKTLGAQPSYYGCVNRCDTKALPPVCVDFDPAGADCSTDDHCAAGLQCMCRPDDPAVPCKRRCLTLRYRGETCADATTACHPAYECTGGICNALPPQDLFTATCPG
jgi:hypothetical protein